MPDEFRKSEFSAMEPYTDDVTFQPLLRTYPAGAETACLVVNLSQSDLLLAYGETHIETEINDTWYEIPSQFEKEDTAPSYTTVWAGYAFPISLIFELGDYRDRPGHYRVIRPLYDSRKVLCCEFWISDTWDALPLGERLSESPFSALEPGSSDLGIAVSARYGVNGAGNRTFEYTVSNLSDTEITIGESHYIEALIGEKWYLTPIAGWNDIAYMLGAGESKTLTACLVCVLGKTSGTTELFDGMSFEWPDTEYRMIKPVRGSPDGTDFYLISDSFHLISE